MKPTNMKNNGPKKPSNATNLVPKNLSIGLLKRSAIRYILGTITSVKKKENIKPKMMVQLNGPQNTTLSQPKKICGFNSVNSFTKSILKQTANGNRPSMVAKAVSNTGMILILPA